MHGLGRRRQRSSLRLRKKRRQRSHSHLQYLKVLLKAVVEGREQHPEALNPYSCQATIWDAPSHRP